MNSYNGFTPVQRMAALRWLKAEYAAGRRHEPLACDACGQSEGILERHSEDYSLPYGDHIGLYGLCFTCHMMIHCRYRALDAWDRYRDAVRDGATFAPYATRNFPGFSRAFLASATLPAPPGPHHAPPTRRVLDEINANGRTRTPPQTD